MHRVGEAAEKQSTASARDVAVLSRDDVPLEDFVSFLPGEKENCSRLGPMRPRKRNEQPPPHCRDLSTENVVGAGEGVSGESLSLLGPLGLRKGGK